MTCQIVSGPDQQVLARIEKCARENEVRHLGQLWPTVDDFGKAAILDSFEDFYADLPLPALLRGRVKREILAALAERKEIVRRSAEAEMLAGMEAGARKNPRAAGEMINPERWAALVKEVG